MPMCMLVYPRVRVVIDVCASVCVCVCVCVHALALKCIATIAQRSQPDCAPGERISAAAPPVGRWAGTAWCIMGNIHVNIMAQTMVTGMINKVNIL